MPGSPVLPQQMRLLLLRLPLPQLPQLPLARLSSNASVPCSKAEASGKAAVQSAPISNTYCTTLPSPNIAPVGGYLEDRFSLQWTLCQVTVGVKVFRQHQPKARDKVVNKSPAGAPSCHSCGFRSWLCCCLWCCLRLLLHCASAHAHSYVRFYVEMSLAPANQGQPLAAIHFTPALPHASNNRVTTNCRAHTFKHVGYQTQDTSPQKNIK